MAFSYAKNVGQLPSFVLASEISLNPPESYVLRHDAFVISCSFILLVHLCWTMSANLRKDLKFKRYKPVSVSTVECHADAQVYSISIINDLSLLPSLILFASLCFFPRDVQVAAYGFWLFTQLVVGWGLAGLFWQNQDKKTILIEVWLAFRVSCPGPGLHESRVFKEIYFLVINLLFAWRFFNVPQHWAPVGDPRTWITGLIVLLSDITFATMVVINLARYFFEVSRCAERTRCKKR